MSPPKTSKRHLVAITGTNAAGKGEACAALSRHGYSLLSLSDVVREEARRRGQEPSREVLIAVAREMRARGGPGILADLTVKQMADRDHVIDSVRHPAEVEILKKAGRFLLIGIDAPIELRFARAVARGRNENAATLERFKELEDRERTTNPTWQQLGETLRLADVTVRNTGTLETFQKTIEDALRSRSFPWPE